MSSEKQPPGGLDKTPLPAPREQGYTLRITFHKAWNIPVSDFGGRSSDPYVLAQINTSLPTRHAHDPPVRYRSPTIHRSLKPEFNAQWVVAGVPASGLELKVRLYDEDANDHDDRLGKFDVTTGEISESWKGIHEQEYKVHKTGANFRAYTLRSCRMLVDRNQELHARMVISIEVLGKTKEDLGKVYTVNNFWRQHFSPVIGRLAGTKANNDQGVEKFDFQANELQLQGPVPNDLYHRYVEFRTFVGGMFEGTGLRGRILNRALHHQHDRIYNYNRQTKYGELPDGPGKAMTLQFLKMVHYDQGGRIFTYVITLDGLFRFTETGKEFGIDLLSKHTMHSDVNRFIAWSGEFLVRRLSKPNKSAEDPEQHTHPAENVPGGPPNEQPPKDPRSYELIIDNDSGTYRPSADLIPVFKKFLKRNFPDLHIEVKACTDDKLAEIKKQQKEIKGKEGDHMVYGQGSDSGSISSSDEDELEERARAHEEEDGEAQPHMAGVEKVLAAVDKPREKLAGMTGASGKEEREKAETRDDQAANGTGNGS